LIIKSTFKSHFKIKKNFKKNANKNIFVKNIVILLLFSKTFLENCNLTILFKKNKKLQTSFLKAPSRHKKFFHQISSEIFSMKIFFEYFKQAFLVKFNFNEIFDCINRLFSTIGSNVLTKTKLLISFKMIIKNNILT
tara:strand:+ start:37 stop:447 length:411 start_codon:yes stop_codon:yes gene_type:complete